MDNQILCGLQNIGNTCYMNAVIQFLVHNKIIKKYLLLRKFTNGLARSVVSNLSPIELNNENIFKQKILGTLTCQLCRLLTDMTTTNMVSPREFKMVLASNNNTFIGNIQNDCHELLSYIIDSIHEETKETIELCPQNFPKEYHIIKNNREKVISRINSTDDINDKLKIINEYKTYERTHQREISIWHGTEFFSKYIEKNFSIITQNFTGLFHSIVTCEKCQNKTHSFEPFNTITLEIPDNEQKDISIYDCLRAFTKDEQLDGINMYNCVSCNCNTVSKKNISFWNVPNVMIITLKRFALNSVRIHKINSYVSYPLILNMSTFVSNQNNQQILYKLTAVIHHYGGINGGHYISYCMMDDGEWYQFDDGCVRKIDASKVNDIIITDSSYIMMYEKIL